MQMGELGNLSNVFFGFAMVHVGAVINAAILVVAYLYDRLTGSFWERIYHLGLLPIFAVCCILVLAGLCVVLFLPRNRKNERR